MTNGFWKGLIAGLAALALAACGIKQSFADAETEVQVFHQRYDAEQYSVIWREGEPRLRSKGDYKQFETFLAGIHKALGKLRSTKQVGWNANQVNAGTLIVLTYESQFERGRAWEAFTFAPVGEKVKLVGYYITDTPPAGASAAPTAPEPMGPARTEPTG